MISPYDRPVPSPPAASTSAVPPKATARWLARPPPPRGPRGEHRLGALLDSPRSAAVARPAGRTRPDQGQDQQRGGEVRVDQRGSPPTRAIMSSIASLSATKSSMLSAIEP